MGETSTLLPLSCQDYPTHLVVQRIDDVPALKGADEEHAVRHSAVQLDKLVAGAADVEKHPQDQARSKLVERLDVKGADAWVELAANEPVKQGVSRVASLCQQALALVAGDVDVRGLDDRVDK